MYDFLRKVTMFSSVILIFVRDETHSCTQDIWDPVVFSPRCRNTGEEHSGLIIHV